MKILDTRVKRVVRVVNNYGSIEKEEEFIVQVLVDKWYYTKPKWIDWKCQIRLGIDLVYDVVSFNNKKDAKDYSRLLFQWKVMKDTSSIPKKQSASINVETD